jgi:antirestriction protein
MEISFVKEENENNMEETSVSVDYVTGYPSLAAFIASDVDQSTLIFRQFDRLAARNLLCLQGELSLLEQSQDRLDEEYKTCSDVTEAESARDWAILREKAASGTYVKERERMDLMMEIRKKTKEYGMQISLTPHK